jgi:hypothetical protein
MMTRLATVLAIANTLVLAALIACGTLHPADASPGLGILKGRGLQIFDDEGRVRASISILPAKGAETETVLVRLIDPAGRPSVKIATSETGAGMSLCPATGDHCAVVAATGAAPELRLTGGSGTRVIAP